MAITLAKEAIASLINMASQGDIDPWDVPVIEVIDRFLSELGLQDLDTALVQANLPQSGQAFLWASMLVLYKADTLERIAEAEEEEILDLVNFEEEDLTRRLPLSLEQHIRRRTSVPPVQKRRVTLQELITQLQEIASELETRSAPKPVLARQVRPHRETLKTITELAHQENLTELAAELDYFLEQQFIQREINSINFEELLSWWSEKKGIEQHQDRVAIFWALLLLSSQSKVELCQTDFYQDLTINKP
ncbi:segregation/condensation protein A [Aphanothece hegewaldii CCALA 016]|uniref:Segregation and condensation protein A n=1 Tax=Aphanothece hegewaldii CCALA 016 TaxID=2107694 RepID=A0A2T1M0K1_9CHRO|nr:segregation/condensation protein A [Aphanothece hegewaldii]PSF38198.1 segregation/condensation protein A [Aphanothece hegewaldii CCALA 016]